MPYGNINVDTVTTSTTGGILGAGNASIMKNRIINGAMVISQRNGTTATTTADDFPVDRFSIANVSAATFSAVQSTTAPAGFNNSFYFNVTAADSSVTGADRTFIRQRIEGYNVADLGFGTASAKTITLSAQVYSSVTGTFGGAILNSAEDRSFTFTYTIASANTWTPISITIAGDTTGTWLTTNGRGINVLFSLGMGSSLTTAAGSWTAGQYYSATGCTNLISTNGANFYITGVQLEVGSSATGFEYRQYGTELMNCQRYCVKYGGTANFEFAAPFTTLIASNSTTAYGNVTSTVPMRTIPSYTTNLIRLVDASAGYTITSVSSSGATYGNAYGTEVGFTVASGLTQYRPYFLQTNNSTSAYIIMSAEL